MHCVFRGEFQLIGTSAHPVHSHDHTRIHEQNSHKACGYLQSHENGCVMGARAIAIDSTHGCGDRVQELSSCWRALVCLSDRGTSATEYVELTMQWCVTRCGCRAFHEHRAISTVADVFITNKAYSCRWQAQHFVNGDEAN